MGALKGGKKEKKGSQGEKKEKRDTYSQILKEKGKEEKKEDSLRGNRKKERGRRGAPCRPVY